MEKLTIWHITREYRGLAEAGGIKDVVRDLSEELAASGHGVSVVLPFYGFMNHLTDSLTPYPETLSVRFPSEQDENRVEHSRVFTCDLNNVRIYCLSSPRFSDKSAVYTYTHQDSAKNPENRRGTGHSDAVEMSLFFQLAALELIRVHGVPPSIIHCHDGHSALIPALIRERPEMQKYFAETETVVTIHNAGPGYHQEVRDIESLRRLTGLPRDVLERNSLRGAVNPFLVAAEYATLNTVSGNYAKELLEIDEYSFSAGLGKAFRERSITITGITNGINPAYLDPRSPASGLPALFDPSRDDVSGKLVCRRHLVDLIQSGSMPQPLTVYGHLRDEETPLYVLQARLTYQKGISVLIDAVKNLFQYSPGFQLLVLGQGEQELEEALVRLAHCQNAEGRFCFIHGYDEKTVKLLFAAGDFFLIPSIYEPCGITDLFALLSGTLPVVHAVGGLVKITDGASGYSYETNLPELLASTILRSCSDYYQNPEKILAMRKTGFNMVLSEYSWRKIVQDEYLPFYRACRTGKVRQ